MVVPIPALSPAAHAEDRRAGPDRRHRPTPMFCRHTLLGGRRAAPRREEERDGAFVDIHGWPLFAVAVAVVALNALDAWFTLLFLSHGGRELNPFVQLVLDAGLGAWPFLVLKTLGIGACVGFLILAKNYRPARWGLGFVFAGYALLLGWHLYLLRWLG